MIHSALKVRRGQNIEAALGTFYRLADDALADRDYTSEGNFVTCFSEVEDDLGQWRGYGGGECGYAIGFSSSGLVEALKARPSTMLLPMCYDEGLHTHVVNDVLRRLCSALMW